MEYKLKEMKKQIEKRSKELEIYRAEWIKYISVDSKNRFIVDPYYAKEAALLSEKIEKIHIMNKKEAKLIDFLNELTKKYSLGGGYFHWNFGEDLWTLDGVEEKIAAAIIETEKKWGHKIVDARARKDMDAVARLEGQKNSTLKNLKEGQKEMNEKLQAVRTELAKFLEKSECELNRKLPKVNQN